MLQRIQSLYLLVAFALLVAVNFFPLAWIKVGDDLLTLSSLGVEVGSGAEYAGTEIFAWLLPVISVVAIAFTVLAFVGYKNRISQMKRCVYAILSIIAYYVAFGAAIWDLQQVAGEFPNPALAGEFPLIALIFIFLAGRAIKRDEDLVRSVDRIR